jgi:predicted PurR-regulated permease PerM
MKNPWSLSVRYFALGLVLVILTVVAWYVRELIAPLVIAGLIAYLLNPLVAWLQKVRRFSQKAASNLVYFVGLTLLIAIPVTLTPIVFDEVKNLSADLLRILGQAQVYLARPLVFGGLRIHLEFLVPALRESISTLLAPLPEDALRLIETTSIGAVWFLLIVVCTYYFMTDWDRLREWLIHTAPEPYHDDMHRLYLEIRKVWIAYLRGQVTLMVIVGATFAVVWSLIGLPGALVLGILAGLFSLVPEVGPLAATILAIIVALLEGSNFLPLSNFWFALLVAGLYIVLINVKNIWLRPLILGRSVRMHEGLVFVAIIAAVLFAGVLGALIVVPVLASVIVIGRYLRQRILGLPPFPAHGPELVPSEPEAGDKVRASSSKHKRSEVEQK